MVIMLFGLCICFRWNEFVMTIYVGCYGFVLVDHYGLYGFSYAYGYILLMRLCCDFDDW